jgi:FAD/FMN-containing dehydrogenase
MLNRKIAEVMTFPTCSVEPNTTIHRAAELMAEHGVGTLKVSKLEHHKSPVALGLMRSIKTALDPHKLMNPGKLLRR